MELLLLYLALAVGVSFLCSVLEAVVLSLTPAYIASVKQRSPVAGGRLEALKQDVERPLAAILSLNTIAHTVGAAGVGAQAQVVFQSVPVSVISGILTLLILVFSEILPKTIGATFWRPLAGPSAWVIRCLTVGLWPLVALSRGISGLLSHRRERAGISRDELYAMARLGRDEGLIGQAEAEALANVFQFSSYEVADVLTPRVVTAFLDAEQTVGGAVEDDAVQRFSRFPVKGENADDILGYVVKTDLLAAAARDEHDRRVRELTRKLTFVPARASIQQLFWHFLRAREQIAGAVDEYGAFAGVITLEDVIETLIGREIMDEFDSAADMRELAKRRTGPTAANGAPENERGG